jgi:2-keto-4-pentenoate hydratase/2-oxohepta-3-ene-1,7-dioic acid hydratase in catechol pathway
VRLATYELDGAVACGVVRGDGIVPVPGESVRQILERGPDHWPTLAASAAVAGDDDIVALEDVRLLAPVPDPDKILCIGLNYRDHAEETGMPAPPAPIVFAKFRNSLAGAGEPVVLPEASEAVDYEAELAVVIGRRCRNVDAASALEYVAGAMAFNDLSARDLQMQTSQWTMGKAIDTFAPCGPALVFLDEIDDLQALRIEMRVNGEVVQSGTTASMIFTVAEIIAFISSVMTLEPGDIIATGTPAGVGFTRTPQLLVASDDLLEVEIESVGLLANPVVDHAVLRR